MRSLQIKTVYMIKITLTAKHALISLFILCESGASFFMQTIHVLIY